jgi:hypothetical protein
MTHPPFLASSRGHIFVLAGVLTVYSVTVGYYLTVIGPYVVDDAFIYFRYADNLARGHGLVYNPGESVEGYTGLTWVLLLSAAAALSVPLIAFSQIVGVLLGGVALVLTWRVAVRVLGMRPAALLPALFLATHRSFVVWSLEGLETQLFTLLLTASLLAWLSTEQRDRSSPVLGILTGLLTLTRPEGFLFAGLMAAFELGQSLQRKSYRWFITNALVFVSIAGAQLVFRALYYQDLLPNTYYAKVVGLQLERGLEYLHALGSANRLAWYAFATLAGVVVFARTGALCPQRRWTLVAVIAYTCYVASIGGDYFEFRFFVPVLPLWAIWTVAGSLELASVVARPAAQRGIVVLTTLTWLGANIQSTLEPHEDTLKISTPEAEAQYTQSFIQTARWLALNLGPHDYIAIRPAGAIAYFTRARCLDLLGLNDRAIARDQSLIALEASPGHQREVTRDYLVRRGISYYVGHPDLSPAPARPGRGHISIEIEAGVFLILHRIAPDAVFQDRIYFLGQHAGSLQGWEPVQGR